MIEDEMLTIEDLATYLKLKPQTIYKWAQAGKIPGAKFGKEWRFRRSSIEKWIDSYIPAVGSCDAGGGGKPSELQTQQAAPVRGVPAKRGAGPARGGGSRADGPSGDGRGPKASESGAVRAGSVEGMPPPRASAVEGRVAAEGRGAGVAAGVSPDVGSNAVEASGSRKGSRAAQKKGRGPDSN